MSKFYVMGNYTPKALQGFIKNPSQDRAAAASELSKTIGATLASFDIVRGQYDFIAAVDAPNFESTAAIKMAVVASGYTENLTILEAVDMKNIASQASKAMAGYTPPG